jgi:hypothetical protein
MFDFYSRSNKPTDVADVINTDVLMTVQISGIKLHSKCDVDCDVLLLQFTNGDDELDASLAFTNSNPNYAHLIRCTITNNDDEIIYKETTML